jgi:hypothetical protein
MVIKANADQRIRLPFPLSATRPHPPLSHTLPLADAAKRGRVNGVINISDTRPQVEGGFPSLSLNRSRRIR